jgi:hypothetical protein
VLLFFPCSGRHHGWYFPVENQISLQHFSKLLTGFREIVKEMHAKKSRRKRGLGRCRIVFDREGEMAGLP